MALDLTGLTNYVKENELQLTSAAIFSAKTASLIEAQGNVQVGIKSAETINVMTTDAVFQAGGTCGFNSSGTTTITQRTITVGKIKIQESICPKVFEAKYTQKALREGSSYDYMAYGAEYSAQKVERIGAALETAIWQGDTGSGNAQLNKFMGIGTIIDALGFGGAGDPIAGNTGALTTLTSSNVIAAVDGVFAALPAALLDKSDVVIFCGNDTFREYVIALRNQNLFHYPVDAANMELVVPGTSIKLIGVNGLNGTDKMFGLSMANLYLGTDLLNEQDRFELFYAKEADEMRFVVEFKMGVQVAFPDEVVYFKLASVG
jgi:hypothetical protein